MPDFPIIDTHLHVWDTRKLRYPWLDEIPLLNKPYLLADYNRATGPVQLEKMVFFKCEVEPSQFMAEAAWVSELAAQDPRIQGIVPWSPLELGDGARPHLEQLAQNPLIKGVRRIIQFEPDLQFCLHPNFIRGVQACADYGFSFDICIDPRHLANTIRMVEQCPNVSFILDHIAKPNIKQHIIQPWQEQLRELAALPNVWCKMSGLVTEADHQHWTPDDLKPYIDHVLDCFGFARTLYGGDWPVSYQATEYPRWVAALEEAVQGCTAEELRQLFRDNAIAFYRLPA